MDKYLENLDLLSSLEKPLISHYTSYPAAETTPDWASLWSSRWNRDDYPYQNVAQALQVLGHLSEDQIIDFVKTPEKTLAVILLADQVPRSMNPDQASRFAYDGIAQKICTKNLAMLQSLTNPLQFAFFIGPLLNAEDIQLQQMAILLIKKAKSTALTFDDLMKVAIKNHDILKQFGRFPERNRALGRDPTDAEISFARNLLKS